MHGKHYGILHAWVTLAHMPLALSWLVFQKVHKNLGANLPHLPKLNELRLDFTFK